VAAEDARLGRERREAAEARQHLRGVALEEAAAARREERVAREDGVVRQAAARGAQQVADVALGVARRVDALEGEAAELDALAVRDELCCRRDLPVLGCEVGRGRRRVGASRASAVRFEESFRSAGGSAGQPSDGAATRSSSRRSPPGRAAARRGGASSPAPPRMGRPGSAAASASLPPLWSAWWCVVSTPLSASAGVASSRASTAGPSAGSTQTVEPVADTSSRQQ